METDIRRKLQRFYMDPFSLDRKPVNMPEESRPQKKCYGRKIAKTAYWMLIAGALAYEGLVAFCDRINRETFKEKILTENGVVLVTEQDRRYCPWKVYQVTAFNGNKEVYDSATGLRALVHGKIEKAKRTLENL